MIKLEIKRADDSIYWTEHFNDIPSANKWLAEEKTRMYWDKTYTHSIVDLDPTDPVKEEEKRIAKEQEKIWRDALKEKKEQAEIGLKSFDLSKIKDADVRQAIKFILDKLEGL